jgi:hypothetical protein
VSEDEESTDVESACEESRGDEFEFDESGVSLCWEVVSEAFSFPLPNQSSSSVSVMVLSSPR